MRFSFIAKESFPPFVTKGEAYLLSEDTKYFRCDLHTPFPVSALPKGVKGESSHNIASLKRPLNPTTQKARSVLALGNSHGYAAGLGSASLGSIAILPWLLPVRSFNGTPVKMDFPLFARPCPVRPRHGFLESKMVHSMEEALDLLAKTREVDDMWNGEVILMPRLSGRWSGVATNAGVTWGKGHDSVTDGKAGCITVPVNSTSAQFKDAISTALGYSVIDRAGITDTPYVEIVENRGENLLVQLRNGPEQAATKNYIPRRTVVTAILEPRFYPDLLMWEEEVKAAFEKFGASVVVVDKGLPLSSHHAVHAIERGIPVVTDGRPLKRGDVLLPETKRRVPRLTSRQTAQIAQFIRMDLEKKPVKTPGFREQALQVTTAIAVMQAQGQWGWSALLLRLRAFAAVTLARAIIAVCAGEIRHGFSRSGPRDFHIPDTSPLSFIKSLRRYDDSRGRIYQHLFRPAVSLDEMEKMFLEMNNWFNHEWQGSGYGGRRWAEIAEQGLALTRAISAFLAAPTPENWSKIVAFANIAINTAHNNGKSVTKFVPTNMLQAISQSPVIGLMNAEATKVVMAASAAKPVRQRVKKAA